MPAHGRGIEQPLTDRHLFPARRCPRCHLAAGARRDRLDFRRTLRASRPDLTVPFTSAHHVPAGAAGRA